MSGLAFPRTPYADFYLGGDWHNLIGDVRQASGIVIERGRKNEAAKPTPSRCTFTLDNGPDHGDGDYSPRNPNGQWYPNFGRNTPVRVGIEAGADNFTRTEASGWGTSPDNGAWTATGSGTDSVTSNTARHVISSSNQARLSELRDVTVRDVELSFTGSIASVTNVTGGILVPWQAIFRSDGTDYYGLRIEVSTAEVITLRWSRAGSTIGDAVTLGTVYSGQTFKVRAQVEGSTLRGKVWVSTDPEPLDWDIVRIDRGITVPGWVGIRSATGLANTNVPVTFVYDDFAIRIPRFTGETSGLKPGMNLAKTDKWVQVECGTIFRRLEQGSSPVQSPMRRSIAARTDIFAYWPVEDGKFATELAPGLTTHDPMRILRGGSSVKFAEDETFPASAPLPVIGTTEWRVVVPPHTPTGSYQWRSVLNIQGGQEATAIFAYEVLTTGSAWKWHVQLEQDGSLSVRAFDSAIGGGIILDDFGNAVITDIPMYLQLSLTQDGADIDYELRYMELGAGPSATVITSGTVAGQTLGTMTRFGVIGGVAGLGFPGPTDTVVGHLSLGTSIATLTAANVYFNGYPGESVTERTGRLVEEAGIPAFGESDEDSTSAAMGPQQLDTLVNLFNEGANTDQGFLYEARGANAFAYKPIEHLYVPESLVTLDHDAGHLAPSFMPTDDDQTVRNDVTAKARRGSEAQAIVTEGPNNVNDPGTVEGAVGRYDVSVTTNPETQGQLMDIAGWLAHVGTVDEPRFPEIRVDLGADVFRNSDTLTYALLDLNIGDALSVENLEDWFVYDTLQQYVLGYTEVLDTNAVHTLAFNAIPASVYRVGELDDGSIRLDSDTSTLAADFDAGTDTSMSVATTGGTLWTTTGAEYPFNLRAAGVVLTATACSGASSPQTITITATPVNGVTKTIPAGTPVSLAEPYYLGL